MSGSRTAIVTGGGTGIGAACAHALAGSCDRVVLVGRRLDRLETTAAAIRAEQPACAVDLRSVDVTDVAAVSAFVDWCSSELGHVDVLVSVVLVTEGLKGLLTRRGSATSGASASAGGRIVTIGSFAASLGTGSPAYASAKAALETYTVTLARDLGPEGITANVVAPGYTGGTELLEGRITPDRHERLVSATAARRAGTPEEIASLVSYLASPLAGYVSGQTIIANGGTYLPG
jgi:3-oxoacyl-[acyl-carrier protein] reductase